MRDGDVLESEASIVVIGDVEKGARILAKGNVIVLGALRGSVTAGLSGNRKAVVVALEMEPVQVKIADLTLIGNGRKRIFDRGPMIILVENGRICSEPIKKNFLSALNFI